MDFLEIRYIIQFQSLSLLGNLLDSIGLRIERRIVYSSVEVLDNILTLGFFDHSTLFNLHFPSCTLTLFFSFNFIKAAPTTQDG